MSPAAIAGSHAATARAVTAHAPSDEVFLFHRKSGLVIAGHNFQFMYKPKGYKPDPRFKLAMGGFPVSLLFSLMMPKGELSLDPRGTTRSDRGLEGSR